MTDAEYKRQQKRIERFVEKWQGPLWLGDWRIFQTFYRDGINGAPARSGSEGGVGNDGSPRATTTSDWYYLRAHIKWDVSEIAEIDDKELEHTVMHELMHCRFAEVRTVSDDWWMHEERAVEVMTMALSHCIREATAGRLKLVEKK